MNICKVMARSLNNFWKQSLSNLPVLGSIVNQLVNWVLLAPDPLDLNLTDTVGNGRMARDRVCECDNIFDGRWSPVQRFPQGSRIPDSRSRKKRVEIGDLRAIFTLFTSLIWTRFLAPAAVDFSHKWLPYMQQS